MFVNCFPSVSCQQTNPWVVVQHFKYKTLGKCTNTTRYTGYRANIFLLVVLLFHVVSYLINLIELCPYLFPGYAGCFSSIPLGIVETRAFSIKYVEIVHRHYYKKYTCNSSMNWKENKGMNPSHRDCQP